MVIYTSRIMCKTPSVRVMMVALAQSFLIINAQLKRMIVPAWPLDRFASKTPRSFSMGQNSQLGVLSFRSSTCTLISVRKSNIFEDFSIFPRKSFSKCAPKSIGKSRTLEYFCSFPKLFLTV